MHGKRILMLVAGALGVVSAFLPWVNAGLASMSGIDGTDAVIVIIVFADLIIIALRGDRRVPLTRGARIVAFVCGAIGAAIGIWWVNQVASAGSGPMGIALSPGAGLYLMIVAGAMAAIGAVVKGSAAIPLQQPYSPGYPYPPRGYAQQGQPYPPPGYPPGKYPPQSYQPRFSPQPPHQPPGHAQSGSVPIDWLTCHCGCCVERVNLLSHGREDVGCRCDTHGPAEQCNCIGCTRDRMPGATAGRSGSEM